MYADDYQNRLAPNRTPNNTGAASWVAGWLDFSATNPDNTNINYLVKPGTYGAVLGPYVRSAALFKCPADKSAVTISGVRRQRVRSVAMNSWVGEGAEGWNGENFRLYKKLDDIVAPLPANLSVIIDEHEGSINDGTFYTDPAAARNGSDIIVDFPASRHGRACGIAFADGRAELHAWRDPRTCPPFNPAVPLSLNVGSPHNVDVEWLVSHSTSPP
jgi:prepilin-type processing-associated H-X9-DG protein